MGGLGNQMFQYALAEKMIMLGYQVKLDTSYFSEDTTGDTKRECYLGFFPKLHIERASDKEIKKCMRHTLWGRIKGKVYGNGSSIYMENGYGFHEEIFQHSKWNNKYYIGYWQSEKYFSDIENTIYDKLSFDFLKLDDKNEELKKHIKSKNSVAIHIRGKDYLKKENSKTWGGICNKEYYKKSISYMQKHLDDPYFYIFTNDMEWAKQILELIDIPSHLFINWNSEEKGYIDLYLMSLCNHQIIANSSFSWWGAYLNKNAEKVVLAPDRWRNEENSEDIYCESWLRL